MTLAYSRQIDQWNRTEQPETDPHVLADMTFQSEHQLNAEITRYLHRENNFNPYLIPIYNKKII